MTRIITLLFAAFLIIPITCSFAAGDGTTPENFVAVYYFHGNFRCANCHNIEQYTKETIEKDFKKELASGSVKFKTINVETKGNEHFTDDYKLYTKSVVLSLVKNGKEVKFDNLTKVWEHLRDKEAFRRYIKNEVEKYLKEL
ncbi:MAG: nitrophenyl compound nitroreductase subunit ArsF family protein [Candidatus Omnitrophica bacterium]|nr:nitrophenyl compound nitroreductase subunit ArsF family protein [Candidatus Omnitrophota bacterium]